VSSPTARTGIAFASAARRYWLGVFPVIRGEIRRLRRRAEEIPDPVLRGLALEAQASKWACLEGAAAFATFVAPAQRAAFVRLLVDLQALLDYADTLMEQPSKDPPANARQLHQAFLAALHPDMAHLDYYRHSAHRDDGGYLAGLVNACRVLIGELPSYPIVAEVVIGHAQRIVFYQSDINLATSNDYPRLARWARESAFDPELSWWEVGAACGSSLAIFAHIAAAADPALFPCEVNAIDSLYWPWAEALHILLDGLIDRAEDRETNQPNLLEHYASQAQMSERLGLLARETAKRAHEVAPHHRLILAGMVALYLSDEQAWIASARPASELVLTATGRLVRPALLLLRGRRLALRVRDRPASSVAGRG
jgi:tetraprenyl-beta-curcumene synthase